MDLSTDEITLKRQIVALQQIQNSRGRVAELRQILLGEKQPSFDSRLQLDEIQFGELLNESHRSLRDDYEVSCDPIETLVEIVQQCDDVRGARMVGGGFGGCVLAVTDAKYPERIVGSVSRTYGAIIGGTPWTHVVRPAAAAREVFPE